MFLVTGTLNDAAGAPLHAVLDFKSTSTPQVASGGLIVTNTDKTIRSNPNDGTFSVSLYVGNYSVTITAGGETTVFNIAVIASSGSGTIDTVATSPLPFVGTPPNTVWNGVRAGQITFNPIANAAAPAVAAETFGGGGQGAGDAFHYGITWVAADGTETAVINTALSTAPVSPHNATLLTIPSKPSGVTGVNIYRSNGGSQLYQLVSLGGAATTYHDFESTANFAVRLTAPYIPILAPVYNLTAGKFFGSLAGQTGNNAVVYLTDQGTVFFLPVIFDSSVTLLGANNTAPSQTITGGSSLLTKTLADGLYTGGGGGATVAAGITTITGGSTGGTVTGLALGYTPSAVILTVQLPSSTATAVTADLIGDPTSDGFVFTLIGIPDLTGTYKLHHVIVK